MRNLCGLLVVGLFIGAVHVPALATEPCLPSPCAAADYSVDTAKCSRLAEWIATGTITSVVHHKQGDPVFKDFAEFTFTVKTSEKGAMAVGRQLRFQVGWCQNWKPLPKDTSGSFRFFGLPLPAGASLPNQYLFFEPVQTHR